MEKYNYQQKSDLLQILVRPKQHQTDRFRRVAAKSKLFDTFLNSMIFPPFNNSNRLKITLNC